MCTCLREEDSGWIFPLRLWARTQSDAAIFTYGMTLHLSQWLM